MSALGAAGCVAQRGGQAGSVAMEEYRVISFAVRLSMKRTRGVGLGTTDESAVHDIPPYFNRIWR